MNQCVMAGDISAMCIDRPAPQNGFDCVCSSGYYFKDGTCTEVDGCLGNSCAMGGAGEAALCSSVRGVAGTSPDGLYSCTCPEGFEVPAVGGLSLSADFHLNVLNISYDSMCL